MHRISISTILQYLNEEDLDNSCDKTDRKQIAGGLKHISKMGKPQSVNLDWGGGRYDLGTEYLQSKNITNLVYDPYKRSGESNANVLKKLKDIGGTDSGTILNVLNVIPKKEDRLQAIKDVFKYLKKALIWLFKFMKKIGMAI